VQVDVNKQDADEEASEHGSCHGDESCFPFYFLACTDYDGAYDGADEFWQQ